MIHLLEFSGLGLRADKFIDRLIVSNEQNVAAEMNILHIHHTRMHTHIHSPSRDYTPNADSSYTPYTRVHVHIRRVGHSPYDVFTIYTHTRIRRMGHASYKMLAMDCIYVHVHVRRMGHGSHASYNILAMDSIPYTRAYTYSPPRPCAL